MASEMIPGAIPHDLRLSFPARHVLGKWDRTGHEDWY